MKIFDLFKRKKAIVYPPVVVYQRRIETGWQDVETVGKIGTYRKITFHFNGGVEIDEV